LLFPSIQYLDPRGAEPHLRVVAAEFLELEPRLLSGSRLRYDLDRSTGRFVDRSGSCKQFRPIRPNRELARGQQPHRFGDIQHAEDVEEDGAVVVRHGGLEDRDLVDTMRGCQGGGIGGDDRGLATTRDAAILKLYACEAYKQVADMGLQVLGGYGYTMEYDLQRHFRESRLGVIGAGTSDIQRNIIAKTMGL